MSGLDVWTGCLDGIIDKSPTLIEDSNPTYPIQSNPFQLLNPSHSKLMVPQRKERNDAKLSLFVASTLTEPTHEPSSNPPRIISGFFRVLLLDPSDLFFFLFEEKIVMQADLID